jgi:sugar transferase EpsL
MNHKTIYANHLKRIFDFTFAAILLVLLFPLLAVIYFACWRAFGRPVIFQQLRPGLKGKVFCLIKFRTMTTLKDAQGQLLPDEQRLTRFGKFLRSSSLDELPELLNILHGDMSFVGPRPLLIEYLPRYSKEQARRHDVRPGLTGWAQVNGRNALSWNEKFELDCYYVDQLSFGLDLRIMLLTIVKIIRRDDITPADQRSMPLFTGKEK